MPLLDVPSLVRLQEEFCLSMKRLLSDLCLDLESQYADVAKSLALPVAYFRFLSQALERDGYAHWKVVGWIEALNDLVYFIDLLKQVRDERSPREFAAELYAECEEKFFENSYLDDLFPRGVSQASGLERRLNELCVRLTQELTQESLCLVPGLPMLWCASRKIPSWTIEVQLEHNVERAELFGTMAIGMEGDMYEAPPSVKRALKQSAGHAMVLVEPHELSLKIKRTVTPLCTRRGNRLEWRWTHRPPVVAIETRSGVITAGPTLVYGKDRQPRSVAGTSTDQVARIGRAWTIIQEAWPEGHEVLALLTTRIIPLKAKGVVSFSYRHRPGLSFINCFDRDNLDLIDDLIHENSHHHLNLLLRKHVMYHGDHNQQIFYSPWRRSLRPLTRHSPRGLYVYDGSDALRAALNVGIWAWVDRLDGNEQDSPSAICSEPGFAVLRKWNPSATRSRIWSTPAGISSGSPAQASGWSSSWQKRSSRSSTTSRPTEKQSSPPNSAQPSDVI